MNFDYNENMEGIKPRIPEIKIDTENGEFKMSDGAKVRTGIYLTKKSNGERDYYICGFKKLELTTPERLEVFGKIKGSMVNNPSFSDTF